MKIYPDGTLLGYVAVKGIKSMKFIYGQKITNKFQMYKIFLVVWACTFTFLLVCIYIIKTIDEFRVFGAIMASLSIAVLCLAEKILRNENK